MWDLESGETLRTLDLSNPVYAVAVTPDGRRAVSGSLDGTLRMWDLESGETLRALEGHSESVDAVAVTRDGRRAVSGSGDKTLRVWDLDSGRPVASTEADAEILCCAIAPDGRTIVCGDASGRVHFLRLEESE
jgi:WD40 repeat protein